MQNHQQQPYQALLIAPFGGVGILADEHAVFGLNLLTQPQRAIVPKKKYHRTFSLCAVDGVF